VKPTLFIWTTILIGLFTIFNSAATTLSFQNSPQFSIENLKKSMEWFTAEPHPMGSKNQSKLAADLKQTLNQFGLLTSEIKFKATIPNTDSPQFGGLQKDAFLTKEVTGYNIVSTLKGKSDCSVLIGGHYDTKYFKDFKFVGANDGGSSTILMMELARVLKKTKFKENMLGSCNINFIFFDGEESVLPNWIDGENTLKLQDNTYGSRDFSNKLTKNKNGKFIFEKKPINLILIIDMIGHKNQELLITKGSHSDYSKSFIQSANKIKINEANFLMEDDHTPFLSLNIPLLHIIDWKNVEEWHTKKDTPDIISYEAIANFGESIIQFLSTKRI
jgi:glutaminyl-peptide cyclotransferase